MEVRELNDTWSSASITPGRSTFLRPGKRGHYELTILFLLGYDPIRGDVILPRGDEPLPVKPWVAVYVSRITNRGRDVEVQPLLFVSHHALSRCAQRFGVRTVDQVIAATMAIFDAMAETSVPEQPRPQGHHLFVDGTRRGLPAMVAVLRRHETRRTPIVATVLFDRDDDDDHAR
jgi:hypothetical protein